MKRLIEVSKGSIPCWSGVCLTLAVLLAIALPANAQGGKSKPKSKPSTTEPTEPPLRGNNTKEGGQPRRPRPPKILNENYGNTRQRNTWRSAGESRMCRRFPKVVKAGFILGGHGGRGVASCRTPTGWSAPAYFEIKGGSIGLQAAVLRPTSCCCS
jgi:hypothetical protein